MLLVVRVLVLVGLIKILLETDKPLLCAGTYTLIRTVLAAAFHGLSLELALFALIAFLLAFLYFWLLDRFRDSLGMFALILVLGLAIGLV